MLHKFFSYLDLMNTMVLLRIQLASHDADASANNVKLLKNHVASHFEHPELSNALVLLMMPSVSHNANTGIS